MKNKKTDGLKIITNELKIIQKTDDGIVYFVLNGKFKQGRLGSYLRRKRKEKKNEILD